MGVCCMHKRKKFIVFNVFIPLLIGAVLYYVLCPDVSFVVLIDQSLGIKRTAIHKMGVITRIVRNYFFDILWAYSLTCMLFVIWGYDRKAVKYTFILAGLLCISLELLQGTGLVKGTFDIIDIMVEILTVFVALIIWYVYVKRKCRNMKSDY